MAAIAKKLAPEEIGRISAWLAGAAGAGRGEAGDAASRRRCRWPAAAFPRRRGRRAAMSCAGASASPASRRSARWSRSPASSSGSTCAARNASARRRRAPPPAPSWSRAAQALDPRRQLHRLPHRARRRALSPAAGRSRRRSATSIASNLTPDADTGLGAWSADEFWRALHHGRSKSGRLLYPAFPYPNYTRVTRADADAMFAYLQSLPPVAQAEPRAHAAPSRSARRRRSRSGARSTSGPARPCRRSGALGRVEPRRLPGRGPGPLQRLPLGAQRARRDPRHARPAGRPDPGAELVRAFADVAARSERRRLAEARGGRSCSRPGSRRRAP